MPLFTAADGNDVGQLYHCPVVLVTDALCYSATDIFAGGMQDNGIAGVLGVDDNTGAGGANVLDHARLRQLWTDGPLRELPGGAELTVSLRRCLRVGARAGKPVEDLGVLRGSRCSPTAVTPARSPRWGHRAGRCHRGGTRSRQRSRSGPAAARCRLR